MQLFELPYPTLFSSHNLHLRHYHTSSQNERSIHKITPSDENDVLLIMTVKSFLPVSAHRQRQRHHHHATILPTLLAAADDSADDGGDAAEDTTSG